MKWRKGPPPEIGWWPASVCEDEYAIRWWDGQCWSYNAHPLISAKKAAECAKRQSEVSDSIKWTDRWWL